MKFSTVISFAFVNLPVLEYVSAHSVRHLSRRAGGDNGGNGGGDPQTSLSKCCSYNCVNLHLTPLALNPAVIASGFANDGQDVPAAGTA